MTKQQRTKLALKVLKRASKDPHECLHYAYVHTDGRQWICDSNILIGFHEHLDLPALPQGLEYVDVDRLLKPSLSFTENLELPSVDDLKCYLAFFDWSSETKTFDFGPGLPLVNANLLLEVLQLVPNAFARVDSKKKDRRGFCISEIVFRNEEGDCALLLPLRPLDGHVSVVTNLKEGPWCLENGKTSACAE